VPDPTPAPHRRVDGLTEKDNDRVGALTDGVVAIALTVLVLDLPTPSKEDVDAAGGLAGALWDHARDYLTFLFAFWLIAAFWVGHREVFRRLRVVTRGEVWLNFLYLAAIVLIPFSSGLLSEHGDNSSAVTVFAANLAITSLSLAAMQLLAHRQGTLTEIGERTWRVGATHSIVMAAINVVVIALAWVDASTAEYCFLLLFLQEPLTRAALRVTGADART
jgi:uncharacterized membrane protein